MSKNSMSAASKHPGVFLQSSKPEPDDEGPTKVDEIMNEEEEEEDEEKKIESLNEEIESSNEKIESSNEKEEDKDVEEDDDDDDDVLPESDRIDETFEDSSVVEDVKNGESLLCDESVEDVEDEEMEPLSLSDDDETSKNTETEKQKTEKEEQKTETDDQKTEKDDQKSKLSCEVEVSQDDEKSDADDARVATRRSQRRRTRHQADSTKNDENSKSEIGETSESESKANVVRNDDSNDDDDAESVTSEMDSLTSGSTLTTRSALRRGAKSSSGSKKSGNRSRSTGKSGFQKLRAKGGAGNVTQNKGKSRRIIFKKSATKAPNSVARAVTSEMVCYKGQYFTKGDIVAVTDVGGGTFYAQVRGFLTDQYCEKSCVITWLLPTTQSPDPDEGFDPATYVVGPEEEFPRKLDFFTFVMHAPDDYFYYRKAPYPTEAVVADQEYVLTRLGPKVRVVNSAGKNVFTDLQQ